MAKQENFKTEYKGKTVDLYEIENQNGFKLQLTNYGCRMVSLFIPDTDILLGFDTIQEYIDDDSSQGALVGRVGNRIGNASFVLNNKTYNLTKNVGEHHLHGGIEGFATVVWTVKEQSKSRIVLTHISPDGDQGYPGNLSVTVVLNWTKDNILQTQIFAETDQLTVVNMTFHPYFNLNGEGAPNINGHNFHIPADNFLALEEFIATGKSIAVNNTPFDFRTPKEVNFSEIMAPNSGKMGKGIDYFYVLNQQKNKTIQKAAEVSTVNGTKMEIWTDQPGVQFYTANYLTMKGKAGKKYMKYSAFCLETQIHPNAPNIAHFPSIELPPNKVYKSYTEYRFSNS